ncbi:MAG: HEAT repeat domain-containing protein [Pirellulaceae bacterium]
MIRLACLLTAVGQLLVPICSTVHAWQIDEQPIAELVEMLESSDVTVRRDAVYELVKRGDVSQTVIDGFEKLISDNDNQAQFQALLGLARAGVAAESAIDSLISELDDRSEQVRYRAADALGKIGAASVSPIVKRWPDANRFERIGFCQSLGDIGKHAEVAVPLLEAALKADEEVLFLPCALALQKIKRNDAGLWIRLVSHTSEAVRVTAIRQLATLPEGDAGIRELLIEATEDDSRRVREVALIAVTKSSLDIAVQAACVSAGLFDDSVEVRAAAIAALSRNQQLAQDFAKQLSELMNSCPSSDVAVSLLRAMECLGESSSNCIEPMLEMATKYELEADPVANAAAASGLAGLGEMMNLLPAQPEIEPFVSRAISVAGTSAKSLLLKAFGSEDAVLRIAAARASGQFEPSAPDLIERLLAAAQDDSPAVRQAVIGSVGTVASELQGELKLRFDAGIASAVKSAASDSNATTRAMAVSQLSSVELDSDSVETLIEDALGDESIAVTLAALETLKTFSEILNRQGQRVLEHAEAEDVALRTKALIVAGLISKESLREGVQAAVVKGLSDKQTSVRIAAIRAASEQGLDTPEVISLIGENLGEDVEVLQSALGAVESLGPAASTLEPTVASLIRHPRADVRIQAIEALGKVSKDKSQLTDRMVEALHDEDWTVRRAACEELGRVGGEAKSAIPRLFELIDSEEDERIATSTIRDIDSAPVTALPQLTEGMKSENFRKRLYAIFLVGKIGPDARSVLPMLEEALEEVESRERSGTTRRYLMQAIDLVKGEDSE